MKKSIFLAIIMAVIFYAKAQTPDKVRHDNNELKFNLLLMTFSVPEISYERILNSNSSIGLSAAIAIEKQPDFDFYLAPYYRLFFSDKKATGFFVEADVVIASAKGYVYKNYDFASGNYGYQKKKAHFGLGTAAGWKLLTEKGYVGEIYLGVARILKNNSYPKMGITIGKRF